MSSIQAYISPTRFSIFHSRLRDSKSWKWLAIASILRAFNQASTFHSLPPASTQARTRIYIYTRVHAHLPAHICICARARNREHVLYVNETLYAE